MRIAVISGVFPKVSETFVLHHINGLRELGHEVDIYSDYRPLKHEHTYGDELADALQARTTYMDIPRLNSGKRLVTAPNRFVRCMQAAPSLTLATLNPTLFGREAFNLGELNRLYTLTRTRHRYDVIHAHFGMVGDRFRFTSDLWQAPLLVSFHGFDYSLWPRQHGMHCYDQLFREASTIVVNSEHTREQLLKLNCPVQKIAKVYPAWDMANFPYIPRVRHHGDALQVLTVARLVEKKGLEDAIKAVAMARRLHPNLRYDIVGDGPLRSRLEQLIDSLQLHRTVMLHGSQSRDYVRHMMSDAHVFLLPSITTAAGDQEGLGIVLLEAQSSGMPVVATAHGPFPEVVAHGKTGFLAPEHAPEELAKWLDFLYQHPDTAHQMGLNARQHMEMNFHPESITRQCVALYEHTITSFQAG